MDTPPYSKEIYQTYYMNDGFTHDFVYIIPQDEPIHCHSANWFKGGSPDNFIKTECYLDKVEL